MPDEFQVDDGAPFTLSCEECDAAAPDTFDAAVAAGWTNIVFFPRGSAEHYVGVCPNCRPFFEAEAAAICQAVSGSETPKGGDPCPT